MPLVCCRHSVTRPDSLRWISVEPLGPGLAQLPGFQLGREVPDDHYRPIHRARHDPAHLHRPRTARPRRVPGRVPRPDPRGLHLGPAPFTTWCRSRSLSLFSVRRADIESFARQLEANGRARATVTRRLCTIAGFYKYAVEEELLDHSPAAHVRRPRVDYESHAVALDRNELGVLLVAAGLGAPVEHALISLLALNGLRVSEATGGRRRRAAPGRRQLRPGRRAHPGHRAGVAAAPARHRHPAAPPRPGPPAALVGLATPPPAPRP